MSFSRLAFLAHLRILASPALRRPHRRHPPTPFWSLYRFIIEVGPAPDVDTYNLLSKYCLDCRRPDDAMERYERLMNHAGINPSPTTYRISIKGLVDNNEVKSALELKEEMAAKELAPDPLVYHYLMVGRAKNSDADGILELYEKLKEKLGGVIEVGVVHGGLTKEYFLRGMEEAVGENSKVKMTAVAYRSVLDALTKNGKFEVALNLFDRMLEEHCPLMRLAVILESSNMIADGYCKQGKFKDVSDVFRKMGDYGCGPDVLSYNVLIEQLCENGLLAEAEELFGEMSEKKVNPYEFTHGWILKKMVDSGLRPNLAAYNKLIDVLVNVGKVDEAEVFYDLLVKKLKMDLESCHFMMKALSKDGKLDEVLKMVDQLLDEDPIIFDEEKEGREEELGKLMEEKERQKAREAKVAKAAKRSARAAVASSLLSELLGKKEEEKESAYDASGENSASRDMAPAREADDLVMEQ
ncbi:hypothetical protein ACJRO7_006267 [Eucalyptus globulus]|uniref:Pentatricopeptide repeat-containing protein n=1 Tax=Eucalyptus globulus TaxID=34317 RepID=A0ABD3IH95_EUCGL